LDVTETDVIAFFGDHPQVKVIAAYVEAIEYGQRFMKVVSQVSMRKPVVLLKAGRTDDGAKAVSSHTGSLAGSFAAYQAAFKQAGVIEVANLSALFDIAWALSCQPLPEHNKAVIFTNAGGPAALASDALASNGFTLAEISKDRQSQLIKKLNPSAQVANPVDMLGGAEAHEFDHCFKVLSNDPNIDAFIPMLVPQALVNPADIARTIVENSKNIKKTVLACMVGEQSLAEARKIFHANNVPMTIYPEVPGKILGAMQSYKKWLTQSKQKHFQFQNLDKSGAANQLVQAEQKTMGELESRPIMAAYGLKLVPGKMVTNQSETLEVAEELGYPVVLKIVSPQILHKSDFGGIALNLQSSDAINSAIHQMTTSIKNSAPEAEIKGFLVQKMAPKGMEVIIGMKRDPAFGPLLMFGLGGVYVELFKDIGFGIAPMTENQAYDLVLSTKAGRLLQGYRGGPIYDLNAVIDAIGRIGQLALDHPSIAEVEVNPLLVLPEGEGALVLDARIILSGN